MDEVKLENRLTAVEKLAGSNRHRIEDMERRQDNLDDLVASVAVMAKEQEHIKEDVTEIKDDVKTLADKPGKRWDGLVDKVVWAVCAAVIAFVLAKVGL